MTRHAAAAEGDRHPPINITFANSAARLAYTYQAEDVGKWYADADTNAVYQLSNSYLPGFIQMNAPGAAVYSYPFNVITVDANEASADYQTLADAIAAAVDGDVISVGPGVYIADNITLPDGVDLVGFGMDVTILSTSGVTALNVGSNSHVANLTVSSVNASGNSYPLMILGSNSFLDNVKGIAEDFTESYESNGIRFAATAENITLVSCISDAGYASPGGSYGIYIADAVGGIEIYQGHYFGVTSSIHIDGNGDVTSYMARFSGSVPVTTSNNGFLYGVYMDYAGDIVIGRYETGNLPPADIATGGKLMYDITTGNLILDIGLSLKTV